MNIAVLKEKLEKLDQSLPCNGVVERRFKRALILDLSDEAFYQWTVPDEFLETYISGPTLAARLWAEFAGSDVEDPTTYESNNPVVITTSALSNSGMPGSEVVSITFRSPVTGSLSVNVCTNTVGMRLDALGFCALIIIGRLRRPTIVEIKRSGVTYNVSELFIGYTVSQIEELIGCGPMTTAMTIGPAGEQKVPFASVVCEGRTTGRGGLGCVFGYKNIKSLCITGFDTNIERAGAEADVKKAREKLDAVLNSSEYCRMMQRSGSSCLVKRGSKYGWAPVFNFTRRTDPRLFHLAGDEIRRRYGDEHGGCILCPILCKHRTCDGIVIPGYDAITMLGSNIACFDMNKIIERYAFCLDLGLDPVSTGNVLGWVYQANSSGIAKILDADFSFKDNSRVLPLIEMIARRTGPGEVLSYGTCALGKACNDESFAYTIRGLECGPFDYRGSYAQCLSDCMGFWFTNKFEIDSTLCVQDGKRGKIGHLGNAADWAVLNERIVMGLQSYGVSSTLVVPTIVEQIKKLNIKRAIIPKSVIKSVKPSLLADIISAYTGSSITSDSILQMGDKCWRLIYEINLALGFDMLSDCMDILPEHFYIDPDSNHNVESIVPYRSLMERYCFLRKQTIASQVSDLHRY